MPKKMVEAKKNKEVNNIFTFIVISFLFFILLFVSGQEGCEMNDTSRQSSKTGLSFSLITGVDYLYGGKTLYNGETFYVGVHIENYDPVARSGEVCISDNVADAYGGIISQETGECKFFNIGPAEIVKKETSGFGEKTSKTEVNPAKIDIYFPSSGYYQYKGLPKSSVPWKQTLYVSLKYRHASQITGNVNVPTPAYEEIILNQETAPLLLSITKSIHKMQDLYQVDLNVKLEKVSDSQIFSYDFTQGNVSYFLLKMPPQQLKCTLSNGELVTDKVLIQKEKLIKCSTLVSLAGEVQQSYPLVAILDYGVKIDKSYPFNIITQ